MARSGRMPPYEVMSVIAATKRRQALESSEEQRWQDNEDLPETIEPAPVGWVARLRHPLVLRLPRGYAFLVAGATAVMLVLAYWVGHQRGFDAAVSITAMEKEAENLHVTRAQRAGTLSSAPPPRRHSVERRGSTAPPAERAAFTAELVTSPGRDPRTKGLNYLVLASDNRNGAEKLLEFLWSNGVNAAAYQGRRRALFQVVALERGFSGAERGGEEYQRYHDGLIDLGEQWEQAFAGAQSFKETQMYWALFNGEPYGKMIIRKDGR